ncbi:MAG: NAD(P)H-binding protein [Woeseia sp.]
MAKTILITGATGMVSTAVIQSLEGSNSKLRVLVRDEAKGAPFKAQGIEVFVGSLDRPRTLAPAFAGVGDSLADLAEDYDTSTQNIEEAIRCELTRREAA